MREFVYVCVCVPSESQVPCKMNVIQFITLPPYCGLFYIHHLSYCFFFISSILISSSPSHLFICQPIPPSSPYTFSSIPSFMTTRFLCLPFSVSPSLAVLRLVFHTNFPSVHLAFVIPFLVTYSLVLPLVLHLSHSTLLHASFLSKSLFLSL